MQAQVESLEAAKVVTIVGARPQFIKAAAVSREIALCPAIEEVLVHTGQHYDSGMSDVFFEQMGIPVPKYHLGVGSSSHGAMTGRQLEKIEEVLVRESPDCVMVYGDTNSTLAGALAASKLNIPVAHVEAGLRSFNRRMPEEINRVVADHLAELHFVPTEVARANLAAEGISGENVRIVGDVMYDVALYYSDRSLEPTWFRALGIPDGKYVLCTVHRAENTDDPARLRSIFEGLANSRLPVVMPLHPRTSNRLKMHSIATGGNVHVVDPVGYLEMVWLESNSHAIATDSGGVQKEAYFHRKPCVVLRDETEWVELVDAGCNILAGCDSIAIEAALGRQVELSRFSDPFYGRGDAAKSIVRDLAAWYGKHAVGAAMYDGAPA